MELTLYDLIDTYEFEDLKETSIECFGKSFIDRLSRFEMVFDTLKDKTDVVLNDNYIKKDMSSLNIPWGEWLGMRIDLISWRGISSEKIVCECLWEITNFGYNDSGENSKTNSGENSTPHKLELEELENIEEEEESKELLKSFLKHEIESSSSSDDFIR